ncbi:protein of unknown function [Xenorhabdus poinarii G6]|uniref:Uncharacterized protein n=1 Tax=Xenorhabdus poinarii G6 TaxID=1354304 RepID=A0A068R674_9GAMM|nr:protein of unknown function [Xenorhabdus poinarii G6]
MIILPIQGASIQNLIIYDGFKGYKRLSKALDTLCAVIARDKLRYL